MNKVAEKPKAMSEATLEVLRIRLAVTVAMYARHNDRVAAALAGPTVSRCALLILALVVAVLGGATGCAASARPHLGDTYQVDIDPAFTPAQQEAVLAALDDWSTHVSVHFTPVVATCSGEHTGTICVHRSTAAEVVHNQGVDFAITFGSSSGDDVDGGETWIAVDVVPAVVLQGVMAHELGHAMGLQHEAGCLMAPTYDGWSQKVTAKDVLQWQGVRT